MLSLLLLMHFGLEYLSFRGAIENLIRHYTWNRQNRSVNPAYSCSWWDRAGHVLWLQGYHYFHGFGKYFGPVQRLGEMGIMGETTSIHIR